MLQHCQIAAPGHKAGLVSHLTLMQELGWYNPLNKETNLNAPSIKKWLSLGAKPSDTVETLLKKAMVMDTPDA